MTACVDTRLESSVTLNLNKPAKDGLYRFVQQVPAGRAVAPLKYTEEQLRDKEAVKQAWKKRHPEPVPAWEYPPAREISGQCSLSIETEEPQESLGIERLEENGFRRLNLRGRNIQRLNLPRGRYRINLFIRLADGSAILSSTLCTLRNDKPLRLALEPPASTDESIDAPLPRELRHERAVLLFADSENEPLAHILQELSVLREFIEKSDIQIHIIKKETEPALFALGDGCFAALPGLKREYPLALAVKDGRCIYAFSGYNVGKARILLNKLWD